MGQSERAFAGSAFLVVLAAGCVDPSSARLDRGHSIRSEGRVARDSAEPHDPFPEVTAAFRTHCGECHTGALVTADIGALRVFDLDDPEWLSKLNESQLRNASWRFEEPLKPSLRDPDGTTNDPSESERQSVRDAVQTELGRRDGAGTLED